MSTLVVTLLGIMMGMAMYLVLSTISSLSKMKARNEKKLEELERNSQF